LPEGGLLSFGNVNLEEVRRGEKRNTKRGSSGRIIISKGFQRELKRKKTQFARKYQKRGKGKARGRIGRRGNCLDLLEGEERRVRGKTNFILQTRQMPRMGIDTTGIEI